MWLPTDNAPLPQLRGNDETLVLQALAVISIDSGLRHL
jgi:hypothetical protein